MFWKDVATSLSDFFELTYKPLTIILVLPIFVKYSFNLFAKINETTYYSKMSSIEKKLQAMNDEINKRTNQSDDQERTRDDIIAETQIVGDLYASVFMFILGTFFVMRVLRSRETELGIDLTVVENIIGSLMIGLGFSLREFISNFVAGMTLGSISLVSTGRTLYMRGIRDGSQKMKSLLVIDRQTSGVIVKEELETKDNAYLYTFIPNSVLCTQGFSVKHDDKF
tara:strand:- start:785 stop:1459 length:675 start_codon:yes stop_codon:yes gene_type:complete